MTFWEAIVLMDACPSPALRRESWPADRTFTDEDLAALVSGADQGPLTNEDLDTTDWEVAQR